MPEKQYKYLNNINSPYDLRDLSVDALQDVSNEVRHFIIDTISKTGGHFGAGLGIVELTVAMHYVFNTPKDKIIFDVGHQGYPHKVLTGRRDLLHTIRQKGGLSGFLKPDESKYDAFGAGHASTSISAALGMAAARDMKGDDYRVLAVIGDGSMTGGMAYEAMNNCGVQRKDLTVIFNDNNMSIDANVSALSNYFNELFASPTVQRIRKDIWELTGKMDTLGDRIRNLASRFEDGMKAIVTPGVLFEVFGFNYFGPISGHNIQQLVKMLKRIKDIKGPVLLHVITKKGKGYRPAEEDSHRLHAIGEIDIQTGKSISHSSGPKRLKYQDVFGKAMLEICRRDNDVVAVTAAMGEGTGLDIVESEMPERVIDVGIAEEHAVTFAGGMAIQGMVPVAAIYSSFLQRSYDQIIHDIALQKLHVVFALDRAGLVGADGPTHHGTFDMAYLRSIPNMIVMAPKDEQELRNMLFSAIYKYTDGPSAIRYPRGVGPGVDFSDMKALPLGKSETIRQGSSIAIVAIGKMVEEVVKAAAMLEKMGIDAEVVNARFVKPLDTDMLDDISQRFSKIMTVEDGQAQGGFGSAVVEYITQNTQSSADIMIHAIPDAFISHGTQKELLAELALDADGITDTVQLFMSGDKSRQMTAKKILSL